MIPLIPLASFASNGENVFFWVWVVLAAVNLVSLVLVLTRRQLVLGWDGRLTYRSLWRSHSIDAADIQAVTMGEGSLSRPVQAWTTERSRIVLPAVTETDLTVVGDWWLAHRGANWQPARTARPPVPPAASWWT
jgi:hypothetical protein